MDNGLNFSQRRPAKMTIIPDKIQRFVILKRDFLDILGSVYGLVRGSK